MRALLLTSLALCAATPAVGETLSAVFTTPDGGVTTGLYDGIVTVTVSGTGQSDGAAFNDAFYIYSGGSPFNDNYYDLAVGTTTLGSSDSGNSINNFIVGALPAYNSDHVYTFQINTGATMPTQLHFGVVDDNFSDNTGAFSITINPAAGGVPEPASWAMMIAGFGAIGGALRRRRAAGAALA